MTDPNTTAIQLCVDRSGSMAKIKTDMEGAINTYLADQAKEPGECLVSIAQFDSEYEVVTIATPIAAVPPFILKPRNSTALYDAMAHAINDLGEQLAELPEEKRPGRVLFVIVTDGLENASQEYTAERVREMVRHQEENYGWVFVYVGANQDAYAVGGSLGIAASNSMNYGANAQGTATVSANLSTMSTRYRSSGVAGFTEEEQTAGDSSAKV